MPKKHQPAYASIKPTANAQPSRSSTAVTPLSPQSVNDRIQQLRREQTPRATAQRRDEITEIVSRRTVPPNIRRILHMVEVDAPKPKAGTRPRRPLRPGQRLPPGPAAPSSWLNASRYAPSHIASVRRRFGGVEGQGRERFGRLARAHDEEFKRLPSPRSLVHHCLRTFALHWEDLVEYEQHYLPTLPIALKEAMLSYLSLYGNQSCLDFKSFRMLFQNDNAIDSASGSEEVRFLDLTGLLNQDYTLKDLEKTLQRPGGAASMTNNMAGLSMKPTSRKEKAPVEVAESWEDEAENAALILPTTLNIPTFPNVTRLSLAQPGVCASWTDLLSISAHLNTLTHLSLAYWPRPSTTPNAATASMVSQHGSVSLGGSHFYSDLDDDWHEAANILRRLSLNTYCLKYLDFEGCTWTRALTWDMTSNGGPVISGHQHAVDAWVTSKSSPGPDWNAAWRQVEYINLSQGWIPSERKSLQNMPAGMVVVQLMRWLREQEEREDGYGEDTESILDASRATWEVTEWVEREKVSRSVAGTIQQLRKAGRGKWVTVDYGWGG